MFYLWLLINDSTCVHENTLRYKLLYLQSVNYRGYQALCSNWQVIKISLAAYYIWYEIKPKKFSQNNASEQIESQTRILISMFVHFSIMVNNHNIFYGALDNLFVLLMI